VDCTAAAICTRRYEPSGLHDPKEATLQMPLPTLRGAHMLHVGVARQVSVGKSNDSHNSHSRGNSPPRGLDRQPSGRRHGDERLSSSPLRQWHGADDVVVGPLGVGGGYGRTAAGSSEHHAGDRLGERVGLILPANSVASSVPPQPMSLANIRVEDSGL
jgi:hypothetical protein